MEPKIYNFNNIKEHVTERSNILVLFSGGLDGTFLITKLLKEFTISCVTALTVDLGGEGDAQNAKGIVQQLGAKHILLDGKSRFAEEYVVPALAAKAKYLNQHPISASLSRPFLAKIAVEVALEQNCDLILHCATSAQNSLRRFNGAIDKLGYTGVYGSPFELSAISRQDKIRYLRDNNIQVMNNRQFSVDVNFWCREFESGKLDNIELLEVPEQLFKHTKINKELTECIVELDFNAGVPIAVNSKRLNFIDLVTLLNAKIGAFGIGRYISLEEVGSGCKFPEVREMPAAAILIDAMQQLESARFESETIRAKLFLEQIWVREAVEGRWYSELKNAAEKFISELTQKLDGKVVYKVTRGNLQLISLTVKQPLYGKDRDAHEKQLLNKLRNKHLVTNEILYECRVDEVY